MPKRVLERLRDIRDHASLDRFGAAGWEKVVVIGSGPSSEDEGKTVDATEYIKSRLDLYLKSWVLPHLDDLIREFEAEREKRRS